MYAACHNMAAVALHIIATSGIRCIDHTSFELEEREGERRMARGRKSLAHHVIISCNEEETRRLTYMGRKGCEKARTKSVV